MIAPRKDELKARHLPRDPANDEDLQSTAHTRDTNLPRCGRL